MSANRDRTVYVGNLDERVSERVLYDILIQAGRVVELYVPRDKETEKSKGYAFAEYETEEIANYAVRLFSGLVTLYNRTLKFAISGQDKSSLHTSAANPSQNLRPNRPESDSAEIPLNSAGLSTSGRASAYSDNHSYGRGRGRGRFGGGGGNSFAKQEPFVLFPDVDLPAVRDVSKEERALVVWSSRLQNYWKSSPYYLEETISSTSQSTDIERFSDWEKMKAKPTRDSFMQFLDANASNFPRELVADTREEQRRKRKKVQWNPESGLQKLDLFEKLEQKYRGQEEKGEKEKKEGEEADQDDEVEEADEEFSDDGDYNQNVDFDDDEDGFNMADDNDDEGIF